MSLLLVVIGYKAVWFTSVLGREGWWGGAASLVFLFLLLAHPLRPGRRWLLLPPAGFLFGTVMDGLLASNGGMIFQHSPAFFQLPLWMPMLWAAFAGAIPIMLRSLRSRLTLVALLGAVGGPMAYYGAAHLGAVSSVEPWAWWVVALEWAIFPPLALLWAYPQVVTAENRAQ